MNVMEQYNLWRSRPLEDPALTRELEAIAGDEKEITDRFYTDLEFGTAGLRGVLGAGTSRMNLYTVRRATQGLASYLLSRYDAPQVAVAYDSRINSELFAREASRVFAGNGIRVHLYGELMPTPALSYAVRQLGCQAGINITASHNPSQYNGYKAYDHNGCQINDELAAAVMARIQETDLFEGVRLMPYEEGLASGQISIISEELIQRFINRVLEEQVNPGLCRDAGLRLVYTPLNGAGRRCVLTALERMGITDVAVVPEQEYPDGSFPTCPYPNPEILEAMSLGLRLVEQKGADLLLATDPDCDRVGVAVMENGKPRLISGNEMGCLLLDYVARSRIQNGTMPQRPVAVRSIVTTTMADAVAARYGIEMRSVLTGFKWIGDQIAQLEAAGEVERFLLGFEESYGYLSGSYVRDKDAVVASVLICEMAAWYRTQGKQLGEALDQMYKELGYYLNKVDSYTFAGSDGMAQMTQILERLRQNPPDRIGPWPVAERADYKAGVRIRDGRESPLGLPSSNVLEYGIQGLGSVVVRPSGTEPKLKVYYSLKGEDPAAAQAAWEQLKAAVEKILEL